MSIGFFESFQLADHCYAVADEAPDDKIEAFAADCCGVVGATGAGEREFESRLTARLSSIGFDPTVIITIIKIVMDLFANCPKPPSPKQVRSRASRRQLARAIRQAG